MASLGQVSYSDTSVRPMDRGLQEAKITGLFLRTEDIDFLKNLIESQTDGDIFGDSLRTNEKKVIQLPVSPGRPALTMTMSFHPMYGRRVIFRQELRFAACIMGASESLWVFWL